MKEPSARKFDQHGGAAAAQRNAEILASYPLPAAAREALQTLLAKLPEAGVPAAAAAPAQTPASGKPRLSFAQFKARHSKAAANAS